MSRPAISCARRKHETASSYCSRYRELTMASRKLREPSTAVYQFGRGSEPMIEVGRAIPADALYIVYSPVVVFWLCGGDRSEIVCIALRRDVPQQRTIGRRQRLAEIAEAVHDRIAPVAAEILHRHL